MEKGIHTPELTTAVFSWLQEQGYEVEDISWRHDECDSIQVNNAWKVWISDTEKRERYLHHFSLVQIDEEGQTTQELGTTPDLEKFKTLVLKTVQK